MQSATPEPLPSTLAAATSWPLHSPPPAASALFSSTDPTVPSSPPSLPSLMLPALQPTSCPTVPPAAPAQTQPTSPHFPADLLLSIDGSPTPTCDSAKSLILGPAGTSVALGLSRAGVALTVAVVRAPLSSAAPDPASVISEHFFAFEDRRARDTFVEKLQVCT